MASLSIDLDPQAQPRVVTPHEYVPVVLTILAAATLAPRMIFVEATGTRVATGIALASTATSLLLPLAVQSVGFATYPPDGSPELSALFPLASNVAFMGAVSAIAVGLLGTTPGTLTALGTYAGLLWSHATHPSWTPYLPLVGGGDPDGVPDLSVRWYWLVGAVVVALAVALRCRNIPLRHQGG